MKTFLLIWSLYGGSPIIVDYHFPSECERAARQITAENVGLRDNGLRALCVEAPSE